MTQEEAIKILKDFHDKSALFSVRTALETLHPELKESEDERIRKEIIAWLKNSEGQTLPIDRYNAALAWLEKQGEQKPPIEMKTPEESLDIDSETYNKIVDKCIYDEQKSAWSEEDERTIHNIDAAIRHEVVFPINELKSMKIWLESLKYRIRPKHEWKRDEKMFQLIEDVIDVYRKTQGSVVGGIYTEELKDFLNCIASKQ